MFSKVRKISPEILIPVKEWWKQPKWITETFQTKKRVLNGFFVVMSWANQAGLSADQQKLKDEWMDLFAHWHVDIHVRKGSGIPIVTYKVWQFCSISNVLAGV